MMYSKIFLANFACAVVAGLATIFFIVGAAGLSSSERDLRNVPWFFTTDFGTISFGLSSFSLNSGGPPIIVNYSDSAECDDDYCDKCDKDGKAAAALTILALFISITVAVISAAQTTWYSKRVQTVAAGLSALSIIFVVIALGLMLGDCYNEVSRATQLNSFSFEWGAGSVLTLVGAVLMALATIFLTVAVCLGEDAVQGRKSSVDSTLATVGAQDKGLYMHPPPPPLEDEPIEESSQEPISGLTGGVPGVVPGVVTGAVSGAVPGDLEGGAPEESAKGPVLNDLEQSDISPRSGKFRACSISMKD